MNGPPSTIDVAICYQKIIFRLRKSRVLVKTEQCRSQDRNRMAPKDDDKWLIPNRKIDLATR